MINMQCFLVVSTSLLFFSVIYLFILKADRLRSPIIASLLKYPRQKDLGQAEARSLELNLGLLHTLKRTLHQVITCCLLRYQSAGRRAGNPGNTT